MSGRELAWVSLRHRLISQPKTVTEERIIIGIAGINRDLGMGRPVNESLPVGFSGGCFRALTRSWVLYILRGPSPPFIARNHHAGREGPINPCRLDLSDVVQEDRSTKNVPCIGFTPQRRGTARRVFRA